MKFFSTLTFSILLVAGAWGAPSPAFARPELPASLARLAARAKNSSTWPELRRYAQSRRSAEERDLAYFVLGYREYQSEDYEEAEKDLSEASGAVFSLADLARYYHASAAYKAGHPESVASLLKGFSARFPSSPVRYEALELLGWGYLQTGQPREALKALQAEPEVRQRPDLALLLGQAYVDAGKLKSAARAYQDVYNAFPTTPEAKAAGGVLEKLKLRLGVNFPPVSDEIATARVEKLYATAHYAEALQGYDDLLTKRQTSPWAWRWNLGRAQCLVRLSRADEAVETLVRSAPPTPELDAQRLAILVQAYVQTGNDTAAAQAVNQLGTSDLKSSWHAVALYTLANYLMRKGERPLASSYYRTLALLFPQTSQGREASWRLAWISYLGGDFEQAQKLFLEHIKHYPQSDHVPAAIYYLGRLEEKDDAAASRALYLLLVQRYVHGYYALEAERRLRALPRERANGAGSRPDFSVSELAAKIPPADPLAFRPCELGAAGEALRSFEILKAVHLDTLAEQDLRARLAREPSSAALRLAFGRFAAEQGQHDRALHSAKKIVPDYYSQQFSELPREIWDLLYPLDFDRLVRRHAALNHLDPFLVMGLIRQESAFNPRATSPSNARGLMQILPLTITRSESYQRSVAQRLYDPTYNLRFGCAYLRKLLKQFNGNIPEALAAYNAGPSRVSQWLSGQSFRDPEEFVESIPFQETRVYVKGVLKDRAVYHLLLTRKVEFAECHARPRSARRKSTAGLQRRSRRRARPLSAEAARP